MIQVGVAFFLSLFLYMAVGQALADGAPSTEADRKLRQIRQKVKMAELILNNPSFNERLSASKDEVAQQLVTRARQNLLQTRNHLKNRQYLEAGATIDFALRDLTACSQLLTAVDRIRKEYTQAREKLDSFVFPEWSDLSKQDESYLKRTEEKISSLRNDAQKLAKKGDYEAGTKLLRQAYQLKSQLIEKLRHQGTVVYDLDFATAEDEYQYLVQRTHHYLDMVDLTLQQKDVGAQTRKLVDDFVYQAMLDLELADDLATEQKLAEAISLLGRSINRLSSLLQMLGIKI